MTLIWNPALETGVKIVDDEHKVLVAELNKLGSMLAASSVNLQDAQKFLDFLGIYVAKHFSHEERCMHEMNCPLGTANKAAHQQFIRMFVEAKLRVCSGAQMDELRKLHASLCDWVTSHIMKIDTGLRSCVKKPAA